MDGCRSHVGDFDFECPYLVGERFLAPLGTRKNPSQSLESFDEGLVTS